MIFSLPIGKDIGESLCVFCSTDNTIVNCFLEKKVKISLNRINLFIDEKLMICSFSELPPLPYGSLIGKVLIDGIELEVFSNYGYEDKPCGTPPHVWRDLHGDYLGYKHHCVSLVRRYLYFKTGKNFAKIWSDGDAKDWYKNADKMGLEKIPLATDLQEGDLICFDKGEYNIGHIGFVQSVEKDKIFITHQNIAQNENDINHCLCIDNINFDGLVFQGGLRVPKENNQRK